MSKLMRGVSVFLSLIFVCVVFSPLSSAESNVIVNFVDTNTGESPKNINLQIISHETGESWNISNFSKY